MGKKTTVTEGNLVIVESPAKAKTIEKFLGKGFLVKSSYGHIRDLSKSDFGVDINNNYQPDYIVSSDKKEVVKELKQLAKKAEVVWIASDEDREGEAIAWHLYETLELKPENTRRIVFHEITKDAIQKAVENPRAIDENLVNAQQARRVLDRLVGFELSPVLWRKVKPSLSAGRVQSVAVRLIVDREREVFAFKPTSSYRVTAQFEVTDDKGYVRELKAELNRRFDTLEETRAFVEKCGDAQFLVSQIEKKPMKKSPAAPFTTSTLQQEASRKLGYSVSQTMSVAQKLYEAGKITYMRTDSVNLSDLALNMASTQITEKMGAEYVKIRKYKTKAKGAQEAHEAIRPTYLDKETVSGSAQEKKLYELIWKRTIASQMSDAQLEKTVIHINAGDAKEKFMATGEVIKFDGFLKVYIESTDSEGEQDDSQGVLLPPMAEGDVLAMQHVEARQRWSQKPARYTEASLVRKLEELGIGRPSTYAPTISTIQNRGYVEKEDRDGKQRSYQHLWLENGKSLVESEKTEISGAERSKLFPTDIGMVVNDFLVKYFDNIVSFDFTAKVEKEFDDVALGKVEWSKSIDDFYKPFHIKVEETLEVSEKSTGERILGVDPASGKQISVRIGRFGPLAQIGVSSEDEDAEKPRFASLRKGLHLETITIEEALDLFKLPRTLGEFEGKVVVIGIGRFGPYIRHDSKFVSLKKDVDDPFEIDLETSIERIKTKREEDLKKIIQLFDEEPDLQVLQGRWGPFIKFQKKNYKIPKDKNAEELSLEECKALIEAEDKKSPAKKGAKKTTAKKTSAKKTTTKKATTKKTTAKKTTAKKKPSTKSTK
ncbi:type I DNA topoisomerase [Carboxylicivirga sp. M1479]|uniref:type I DNA topoisomerase n=1 Tax=Carboxylicivirga sp. M1479 TaxID=2594476 RepID=UPI001177AF2D|nr:type I DNA topoisomerase [Carboxylicivirga sp. M1479]TRX61573.1 type I DNA topoisomerase [Carboxylicivirga sp. M1479]